MQIEKVKVFLSKNNQHDHAKNCRSHSKFDSILSNHCPHRAASIWKDDPPKTHVSGLPICLFGKSRQPRIRPKRPEWLFVAVR